MSFANNSRAYVMLSRPVMLSYSKTAYHVLIWFQPFDAGVNVNTGHGCRAGGSVDTNGAMLHGFMIWLTIPVKPVVSF